MKPIVSVCIFTYNHEKYIRQGIESALMQRTNFDFEIVIGEDYSTDTTKEICLNYANQFPGKIKVLDRGKNIGMCENIFDSLKRCEGKYIAVLDGDDYWIDPLKLQRQYDFLERNPEMNMVFHQTLRMNELNGIIDLFVKDIKPVYKFTEALDKWIMATGSMFFRREAMVYPEFLSHSHNFDVAIQMLVNREGNDIGYIDEMMSIYRINTGSNTNSEAYNVENTAKRLKVLYGEFNELSKGKYHQVITEKINEFDKLIREANSFQFKPYFVKGLKKFFKFFGFKLMRVHPSGK